MAGLPSIGDILMLSQLAWKIGRAFTAGRNGAPAEFLEVETEINGLAKALKLLAETLFREADDSIFSKANEKTKFGVATILLSCQRTVHNLDSLMDQYQVIKRHRTTGGFTIDRSWSDLVLHSYKTMMWTTEGGNIYALRNLLRMHTSTVTLLMQAAQSKSLDRLHDTVAPMAETIEEVHQQSGTNNLTAKLEEVQKLVIGITSSTVTPQIRPARDPDSRPPSSLRLDMSRGGTPTGETSPPRDQYPSRQSSRLATAQQRRPQTPQDTPELTGSDISSVASSIRRASGFQSHYSDSMYSSSDGSVNGYTSPVGSRSPNRLSKKEFLSRTPELPEPHENRTAIRIASNMPPLPPPAMGIQPDPGIDPAMRIEKLSLMPPTQPAIMKLHRSSTTASQQVAFEQGAFRNSAILCDVRGALVEYTQANETEEDPYGVEMVEACHECRICVVRKREALPDRSIRMITSIWVFSDDNTVRMQQKLADGELYVPYSSYFSHEKISVTVPTELKFHDVNHGSKPIKTAKTSWINYVFETPNGAALFQNELMGRTLLGTYKTEKTLRIHEGLSGVLAYQEQMCGMENLRIWEDESTGAVIATIHFSAHFRQGYLAFYLNSNNTPVRVKDEGGREIKVKGLRVPLEEKVGRRKDSGAGVAGGVDKAGASALEAKRRGSEVDKKKFVSGAKIEFATEGEKRGFLVLVREVQKVMRELPDLVGM